MNVFRRLAALLTGAVLTASPMLPVNACAANQADEQTIREYSEIMLSLINDARAEVGLDEVYLAPVLCDYSQTRALELAVTFTHERPDGQDCFSVMKNDDFFYNLAAENIAAGNPSPEGTFEQLMLSPSHRQNILTDGITHVGISYNYDPDSAAEPSKVKYAHYWQMFLVGVYDTQNAPAVFEGQYIPDRELGDADDTKQIDTADAACIMQYSARRSAGVSPNTTEQFRAAADVNGDGQINAVDAQIILAYTSAHGADPDAVLSDYTWK